MSKFHFPGQTNYYSGKVRDVYFFADDLLVMVASNRISAFDVILPEPIPYKGQVLNQVAANMLEACRDICPNWLLATPAPAISAGKRCTPFAIEMVVRGHLTGHAWRTYNSGQRTLCGAALPDGMKENEAFPFPIITPSTKATEGHDEDITPDQIIEKGLCTQNEWSQIFAYALALFERGKSLAAAHGLILADTKYEFGKIGDEIYLMDEIHTPDSSRYFYQDGFEDLVIKGEKPRQLSKEFVREWLMEHGFMGKEGQKLPTMSKEWVTTISERYIQLYETLLGKKFIKQAFSDEENYDAVVNWLGRNALSG